MSYPQGWANVRAVLDRFSLIMIGFFRLWRADLTMIGAQ
jgi:hypothetical protein